MLARWRLGYKESLPRFVPRLGAACTQAEARDMGYYVEHFRQAAMLLNAELESGVPPLQSGGEVSLIYPNPHNEPKT